jgi:hypothetical protein
MFSCVAGGRKTARGTTNLFLDEISVIVESKLCVSDIDKYRL